MHHQGRVDHRAGGGDLPRKLAHALRVGVIIQRMPDDRLGMFERLETGLQRSREINRIGLCALNRVPAHRHAQTDRLLADRGEAFPGQVRVELEIAKAGRILPAHAGPRLVRPLDRLVQEIAIATADLIEDRTGRQQARPQDLAPLDARGERQVKGKAAHIAHRRDAAGQAGRQIRLVEDMDMHINQARHQDAPSSIDQLDAVGPGRQGARPDALDPPVDHQDVSIRLHAAGRGVEQARIGDQIGSRRVAIRAHHPRQLMRPGDEDRGGDTDEKPEGHEKSKHVCLPIDDGVTGPQAFGRIARYPDSGRAECVSCRPDRISHPPALHPWRPRRRMVSGRSRA